MENLSITSRVEEIFNAIIKEDEFVNYEARDIQHLFSFLDDYSIRNHLSISLINKSTLDYVYQARGFYDFWQMETDQNIDKIRDIFPLVFDNDKEFKTLVRIHEEVLIQFPAPDRLHFISTFGGVKATAFGGKQIRLMVHNVPLELNGELQYKIQLCEGRDISRLLANNHFWLRIKVCNQVFYYISTTGVIYNKEILSRTELTCVQHWASGKNLSQIADTMYISIHTVKNHLKSARNRFGARDNTALTELCMLIGIL